MSTIIARKITSSFNVLVRCVVFALFLSNSLDSNVLLRPVLASNDMNITTLNNNITDDPNDNITDQLLILNNYTDSNITLSTAVSTTTILPGLSLYPTYPTILPPIDSQFFRNSQGTPNNETSIDDIYAQNTAGETPISYPQFVPHGILELEVNMKMNIKGVEEVIQSGIQQQYQNLADLLPLFPFDRINPSTSTRSSTASVNDSIPSPTDNEKVLSVFLIQNLPKLQSLFHRSILEGTRYSGLSVNDILTGDSAFNDANPIITTFNSDEYVFIRAMMVQETRSISGTNSNYNFDQSIMIDINYGGEGDYYSDSQYRKYKEYIQYAISQKDVMGTSDAILAAASDNTINTVTQSQSNTNSNVSATVNNIIDAKFHIELRIPYTPSSIGTSGKLGLLTDRIEYLQDRLKLLQAPTCATKVFKEILSNSDIILDANTNFNTYNIGKMQGGNVSPGWSKQSTTITSDANGNMPTITVTNQNLAGNLFLTDFFSTNNIAMFNNLRLIGPVWLPSNEWKVMQDFGPCVPLFTQMQDQIPGVWDCSVFWDKEVTVEMFQQSSDSESSEKHMTIGALLYLNNGTIHSESDIFGRTYNTQGSTVKGKVKGGVFTLSGTDQDFTSMKYKDPYCRMEYFNMSLKMDYSITNDNLNTTSNYADGLMQYDINGNAQDSSYKDIDFGITKAWSVESTKKIPNGNTYVNSSLCLSHLVNSQQFESLIISQSCTLQSNELVSSYEGGNGICSLDNYRRYMNIQGLSLDQLLAAEAYQPNSKKQQEDNHIQGLYLILIVLGGSIVVSFVIFYGGLKLCDLGERFCLLWKNRRRNIKEEDQQLLSDADALLASNLNDGKVSESSMVGFKLYDNMFCMDENSVERIFESYQGLSMKPSLSLTLPDSSQRHEIILGPLPLCYQPNLSQQHPILIEYYYVSDEYDIMIKSTKMNQNGGSPESSNCNSEFHFDFDSNKSTKIGRWVPAWLIEYDKERFCFKIKFQKKTIVRDDVKLNNQNIIDKSQNEWIVQVDDNIETLEKKTDSDSAAILFSPETQDIIPEEKQIQDQHLTIQSKTVIKCVSFSDIRLPLVYGEKVEITNYDENEWTSSMTIIEDLDSDFDQIQYQIKGYKSSNSGKMSIESEQCDLDALYRGEKFWDYVIGPIESDQDSDKKFVVDNIKFFTEPSIRGFLRRATSFDAIQGNINGSGGFQRVNNSRQSMMQKRHSNDEEYQKIKEIRCVRAAEEAEAQALRIQKEQEENLRIQKEEKEQQSSTNSGLFGGFWGSLSPVKSQSKEIIDSIEYVEVVESGQKEEARNLKGDRMVRSNTLTVTDSDSLPKQEDSCSDDPWSRKRFYVTQIQKLQEEKRLELLKNSLQGAGSDLQIAEHNDSNKTDIQTDIIKQNLKLNYIHTPGHADITRKVKYVRRFYQKGDRVTVMISIKALIEELVDQNLDSKSQGVKQLLEKAFSDDNGCGNINESNLMFNKNIRKFLMKYVNDANHNGTGEEVDSSSRMKEVTIDIPPNYNNFESEHHMPIGDNDLDVDSDDSHNDVNPDSEKNKVIVSESDNHKYRAGDKKTAAIVIEETANSNTKEKLGLRLETNGPGPNSNDRNITNQDSSLKVDPSEVWLWFEATIVQRFNKKYEPSESSNKNEGHGVAVLESQYHPDHHIGLNDVNYKIRDAPTTDAINIIDIGIEPETATGSLTLGQEILLDSIGNKEEEGVPINAGKTQSTNQLMLQHLKPGRAAKNPGKSMFGKFEGDTESETDTNSNSIDSQTQRDLSQMSEGNHMMMSLSSMKSNISKGSAAAVGSEFPQVESKNEVLPEEIQTENIIKADVKKDDNYDKADAIDSESKQPETALGPLALMTKSLLENRNNYRKYLKANYSQPDDSNDFDMSNFTTDNYDDLIISPTTSPAFLDISDYLANEYVVKITTASGSTQSHNEFNGLSFVCRADKILPLWVSKGQSWDSEEARIKLSDVEL